MGLLLGESTTEATDATSYQDLFTLLESAVARSAGGGLRDSATPHDGP